jgi:uncharacterized protein (TIRG00374 family)
MPDQPAKAGEPLDGASFERAWSHLGRRLLVPALLGVLAFVGLAVFADARQVLGKLSEFDAGLIVPLLGLSLINYGLRFLRWQLYLGRLDLNLPLWHSLAIFLVGFLLSVTPGKIGELGKAWLVRELGGGPARRAVAVVVAERLTDLLAVFALACVGSRAFPSLRGFAWVGLGVVAGAMTLLAWPRLVEWLIAALSRIRLLAGRVSVLREIQTHLRALLSPAMLVMAIGVGMVAWGAEGLGFALVVDDYSPGAPWLAGVFSYSLGSLVGGVSMLPGGLLATEGVLAGLLAVQGLDAAAAASATMIVRAATLWFAVALGLLALPFVWRWLARRPAVVDPPPGVERSD